MLKIEHLLVIAALVDTHAVAAQARAGAVSAEVRHADSLYDRHDYAGAARGYRVVLAATPNDGRSWYRLGVARRGERFAGSRRRLRTVGGDWASDSRDVQRGGHARATRRA
jgi:hypothetical protein